MPPPGALDPSNVQWLSPESSSKPGRFVLAGSDDLVQWVNPGNAESINSAANTTGYFRRFTGSSNGYEPVISEADA